MSSYNFLRCDREQQMLLPPSVGEWLEQDHVAWTVIDAVGQFDLAPFLAGYRVDGRGGAAFDPRMMVALLLYAYCVGERSSRKIERQTRTDVAFRVICANQLPDHVTICRFRKTHKERLKHLFLEVLRLCAEAGLVNVGTVALDGRKVGADAALSANRTLGGIDAEIERMFDEAEAVDAVEDGLLGDQRGDEVPDELRDPRSRLARLARAKQDLEQRAQARHDAHEQHLAERTARERASGRKLRGRKPKAPDEKAGAKPDKANTTDPDSRVMSTRKGYIQGYNAQAVATTGQIVIASHVTQDATDYDQLHPMIEQAAENIARVGIDDKIEAALADAGYASMANFEAIADDGPEFYVATENRHRARERQLAGIDEPPPPNDDDDDPDDDPGRTARKQMQRKMQTEQGKQKYRQRCSTIEPVFGQHLTVNGLDTFMMRGLDSANAEFHLINAAHNLNKYHRATRQAA